MDGATEAAQEGAARGQLAPLEGLLVAGTYRVSARLGGGGMGEVYQAEHLRLGNPLAIKFLRAGAQADARSTDRFHHEARRAAAIRSEHVVRVFDYGRLEDGTPYLVMERLFGEDLRALLEREGSLPIRRAVQLVMGACRGLSAVHAAGLVHRDLKPANLFLEQAVDGTEICKVLDFGVAKALESETTRPGSLVGTIRYMAPEQLEDAASATSAADIYALGTILYECVTGVPAHQGATLEETMFNIVHRGVPKPSVHRPVPEQLEAVMVRAVAKDPSRRFTSMEDFARALAAFGPVRRATEVHAPSDEQTLREERNPRPVRTAPRTFAVALLAGAVGAVVGWSMRGTTATSEQNRASAAAVRAPAPVVPSAAEHVEKRELAPKRPAARVTPESSAAPIPMQPRPPKAPDRVEKRLTVPAASATNHTPIAGRFDPNDPYE